MLVGIPLLKYGIPTMLLRIVDHDADVDNVDLERGGVLTNRPPPGLGTLVLNTLGGAW